MSFFGEMAGRLKPVGESVIAGLSADIDGSGDLEFVRRADELRRRLSASHDDLMTTLADLAAKEEAAHVGELPQAAAKH